MNDLKDQFLQRSITGLRDLAARAGNSTQLAGTLSAEAFRLLHTIKGTAQTFGLSRAAGMAHELEGHLTSPGDIQSELLVSGISHLIELLEEKEVETPRVFAQKQPAGGPPRSCAVVSGIPKEVFLRFSEIEKTRIFSAYRNGLEIFCLERGFDMADMTAGFKTFRDELDNIGETIAALPGANEPGRINFRFYLAAADPDSIESTAAALGARLDMPGLAPGFGLFDTLSQIADHGLHLAGELGKEVNIIVCARGVRAGHGTENVIFDILLHLVRNAIDHAFSSKGNIFITLSIKDDGLSLSVEDDGAGLDRELIRSKAIENGMIRPEDRLDDGELLDLIFSPGFSTAGSVSEISGRGVGLDAVKNLVEDSGGTVRVESEKGKGTIFEVFLPDKKRAP
jgi:HPt (histidine-containing phosphotransfer) domain-containing protein